MKKEKCNKIRNKTTKLETKSRINRRRPKRKVGRFRQGYKIEFKINNRKLWNILKSIMKKGGRK